MTTHRGHDITTNKKPNGLWAARTTHDGRVITRFGLTQEHAVQGVKEELDRMLSPQEGHK